MLLLLFFLGGKNASCDYLPNARTLKDLRKKQLVVSSKALSSLQENALDTAAVSYLLKHGEVNFRESNTALDSCKVYLIEGSYQQKQLSIHIANCEKEARLEEVKLHHP